MGRGPSPTCHVVRIERCICGDGSPRKLTEAKIGRNSNGGAFYGKKATSGIWLPGPPLTCDDVRIEQFMYKRKSAEAGGSWRKLTGAKIGQRIANKLDSKVEATQELRIPGPHSTCHVVRIEQYVETEVHGRRRKLAESGGRRRILNWVKEHCELDLEG